MTLKHCFVITSAINTKFGVYNAADRLLQTVITIRSIKQKIPDAKIVLVEMAAIPLTEQQTKTLTSETDLLLDFTEEESVQQIYNSTENWDVVKNGTEIMIFGQALKMLVDDGELDGFDRIHKISGRYVINDQFQPDLYTNEAVTNKIVLAKRRQSQFSESIVGQKYQYMSRLWSWPNSLTKTVLKFYDDAFSNFIQTIGAGRYIDIEHSLFKLLPPEHVYEVESIGIEGLIGPNGQAVKD